MASTNGAPAAAAPKVKVESKGANGTAAAAGGSGGGVMIDKVTFWRRLKTFFDLWKEGRAPWAGENKDGAATSDVMDAVVLAYGPDNEDIMYSRSAAIQLMLFGYDLPETIMVFTFPETLTVLTAPKKAKIIRDCGDSQHDIKLVVIEKDKNTLQSSYDTLQKAIKSSRRGKRVGYVKKDQPKPEDEKKSTLVSKFMSQITKNGVELVDIALALAQTTFVKDEVGLRNVRAAAGYTSEVLKQHLLAAIEDAIENDLKVTHTQLADKCDDCIQTQAKIKLAAKLEQENVESCYTPIIMSGAGPYDLKPSASSDDKTLDFTNTIILELGTRYKGYCSNIGRTYFVDPSPDQKDVYTLLTQVHAACLEALKAGQPASNVMLAAERLIKGSKPALMDHFVKNCGFGIGLEFREPDLLLTKTNPTVLQPGMVFNLCIGFGELVKGGKIGDKPGAAADSKEAKKIKGFGKSYAVLMADTVVIKPGGELPEVLTNVNRSYDKVSYELDDAAPAAAAADDDVSGGRRTRGAKDAPSTRAAQSATGKMSAAAEEKLRQHQQELERKQREQTLKRLAAQGVEKGFKPGEMKEGKFESYSDPSKFPAEARQAKTVVVDAANESILCPMPGGQMVPFHIQTIKNSHKSEENGWYYLRLQFHVPAPISSTAATPAAGVPAWADPNSKFLRELTYRTKTQQLNKAFFDIQELRKRVANRVKDHNARASLVEQEDLKVDMKKGPVAKLKDLQIKPQLAGRKGNAGYLEAHVNGFRFITSQKLKIDIIYKNIKHAFFQPAERSTLNVLMHFELHNPIMLGKKAKAKKTNYVQFYVEIMEASQDLDSRNRLDEDGLAEEQEERANRRRWNEQFRAFVTRVQDHTTKESEKAHPEAPKIEFDSPYRELAFTGTPSKSIVDIMPTVHCLVALDDTPPMVVTLADVEVAIFERVQFNLRNFDLVFILKGLEQTVQVQAIPSKHFDSIKQWLNSCDIVFYEMAHNILWKKVLKEIKADLQGFYEGGGWRNLSADAEGDEEGDASGSGSDDEAAPAAAAGGESKEEKKGAAAKPKAKPKAKGRRKKADSDDSGSDFQPSDDDGDESSDYTSGSEVDDSDDGLASDASSGADDDEEGEGDDWDTLAKKAAASDREANRREQEEEKTTTRTTGGKKKKGKRDD